MNLIASSLCSLCGMEEEFLEHLLFQCTLVNRFWILISNWLSTSFGYSVDTFTETDIIFGFWNSTKEIKFVNHIILLGKRLLYQCKSMNSLSSLIVKFDYTRKIEEKIARMNDKFLSHYKKWEKLLLNN